MRFFVSFTARTSSRCSTAPGSAGRAQHRDDRVEALEVHHGPSLAHHPARREAFGRDQRGDARRRAPRPARRTPSGSRDAAPRPNQRTGTPRAAPRAARRGGAVWAAAAAARARDRSRTSWPCRAARRGRAARAPRCAGPRTAFARGARPPSAACETPARRRRRRRRSTPARCAAPRARPDRRAPRVPARLWHRPTNASAQANAITAAGSSRPRPTPSAAPVRPLTTSIFTHGKPPCPRRRRGGARRRAAMWRPAFPATASDSVPSSATVTCCARRARCGCDCRPGDRPTRDTRSGRRSRSRTRRPRAATTRRRRRSRSATRTDRCAGSPPYASVTSTMPPKSMQPPNAAISKRTISAASRRDRLCARRRSRTGRRA